MRLSARVQKLEGAEPRCDARVLRLAPEGHVPSDADRRRRCGGCHVLVIEEEIVEASEPLELEPGGAVMNRSRVAKLERHAREHPCPKCGRVERPDPAGAEELDLARLSEEQGDLARLVEVVALPPCERGGRGGYDLTHLTDGQLDRALHLLRALFGHQELNRPSAPDEFQGRPV